MRALAALLTLLVPGAGHMVLGRRRRGAIWFVVQFAGFSMLFVSALAGALGGVLLVRVIATIDVLRAEPLPARRSNAGAFGLIAVAVGARFLTMTFFVEAFGIPQGAMSPTLLAGDHVFVSKRGGRPHRGDVIVFRHPQHPSLMIVSRVIGVAGDTIRVRHDAVTLNDVAVERRADPRDCSYPDHEDGSWVRRSCTRVEETNDGHTYVTLTSDDGHIIDFPDGDAPYVVPDADVFVMGDNRDNAADSRSFGAVPIANVVGFVWKIWWSSGGPGGIRWERVDSLVH